MIKITCQVTISCLSVSPDDIKIPKKLKVIKKQNIGDFISYGRHNGEKAMDAYIIIGGKTDDILDFIELFIKKLNPEYSIKIRVDINVSFKGQCNFELSESQLKKISNFAIPLSISCYNNE